MINNLVLWRHAEAEIADVSCSVETDLARQLTPKGQRQAKRMARWLQQHQTQKWLLVSSPAARAVQTAAFMNQQMHIESALSPSASLEDVLSVLTTLSHSEQPVLIVGHQPWMGLLLAYLTQGLVVESPIKKGAIWWLRPLSELSPKPVSASAQATYAVLSVQTPSLL